MTTRKESQVTVEHESIAMLGKALADLRRNKKMTQEKLSEKLDITTRTVQNYENGRTRPSMSVFLQMLSVLEATDDERSALLSIATSISQTEEEQSSTLLDTYKTRLYDIFEGKSYKCFFVSNHREYEVDVIEIEDIQMVEGNTLRAEAKVRERDYECIVIPSLEGSYVFFQLTCKDPLHVDRCLMILPRNKKIRKSLDVGVAAILSLAPQNDDDRFFPSFQLCAVISDNYCNRIRDEVSLRNECIKELELPKSSDSFHIHLPDIGKRSDRLYHRIVHLTEDATDCSTMN